MNDLRTAVQQALEALDAGVPISPKSILHDWFRAALTQQAEPVQDSGFWGRVAARQASRIRQLETAAQQALEVLQFCTPKPRPTDDDYAEQGWKEHNAAITALRAVLAQQAEPVAPVAWDVTKNGRLIYDYDFTHDVSLRVMGDFEDDEQRVRYAKQIVDKLNAAPAQQAEPDHETRAELAEQQVVQLAEERDHYRNLWQKAQQAEPVAWRSENANPPGGYVIFQQYPQALADLGKPIQPLYTAPPRRTMVPLTEEEIYHATRHCGVSRYTAINIARAVEKASREKNHGKA